MSWARSLAIGLLVGAMASVTPLELSGLVIVGLILSLWSPVDDARKGRTLAPLRHAALRLSLVLAISTLATRLPFKHLDQRTTLESPCVTVAAVAKAAEWRAVELSPEMRTRMVCAPSATPTLRELRSALEASGLEVHQGYCGNGATLLWGASPMSGMLQAKR